MENRNDEITLTESEEAARKWFLQLVSEGMRTKCDTNLTIEKMSIPAWYDEAKYERGKKYYQENRVGISASSYIGLLSILSEHKGLQTLILTNRSSTAETARKRYLSTTLHTWKWYESDLFPGSPSYNSLKRIRRMHLLTSNLAEARGIGSITQTDLAGTVFGFIGFVLVRPHIFACRADNREDLEAFTHLWAVLAHLLGVEDRFNICLLPLDVLKIVFEMIMRYVLYPIIQLETSDFTHMTGAVVNGLKKYVWLSNFEAEMFMVKRALCIPGYQFKTDMKKEFLCRSILSQDDVEFCNTAFKECNRTCPVFFKDIPVITINKVKLDNHIRNSEEDYEINLKIANSDVTMEKHNYSSVKMLKTYVKNFLGLCKHDSVTLTLARDEREWSSQLNDKKFYEMSMQNKFRVAIKCFSLSLYESRFGKYLIERLFEIVTRLMRKDAETLKCICD